ncbi:Uncharacterised protein [Escherichia coli]|uniref:Uncharacterized protein n=1 Tax=Escherichia coli TaxID=562 RepID=A0A377BH78_ECOLX|nr:Uncharacterised protein [Escherichia coli]
MAAMAQIGAQIQKNSDGSVNTLKTLESIAKIFPTLRPEQQKSAADALGLTPELLALMRDGERMKKLLAKSDEFGLTVDPALNQQLSEVNGTMNELSASWDGLWQRSKNKALKTILSDGSVKDGLEGVTDLFTNGDFTGLSHALGFINSNDAEKLRRIQNDKELYNSLPRSERGQVDAGFMTDAVRSGTMRITARPILRFNCRMTYPLSASHNPTLHAAMFLTGKQGITQLASEIIIPVI